jgi:hypothetical protein
MLVFGNCRTCSNCDGTHPDAVVAADIGVIASVIVARLERKDERRRRCNEPDSLARLVRSAD